MEANILEHITVSAELQAKYDRLAPMLEEYNRFVETKGMSGWQKYEPEYPTRDILPGDIARTEGEEYDVTKEKLSETITKIDSLMQNQEVTGLLGLRGRCKRLSKGGVGDRAVYRCDGEYHCHSYLSNACECVEGSGAYRNFRHKAYRSVDPG